MGCGLSSDSSDISQNNNNNNTDNNGQNPPKKISPTPSAISYRKADNILAKQIGESQSTEILHVTINSNPNNHSSNAEGNCYINHSDSVSSCGSSTTGAGGVGDANIAHVLNLAHQQQLQQQQLWKNCGGTSSATTLLGMMLNNNNNNNSNTINFNNNINNNTSNAEDIIAASQQKCDFISYESQDDENRPYHSLDPFLPSSASNAEERASSLASPPNMSHTASHTQNPNITNLFIGIPTSSSSNAGSILHHHHQNNNINNNNINNNCNNTTNSHHQLLQYPSTDVGINNNGLSSCGGGGGGGAGIGGVGGGYCFSAESKSRDSRNCSAVAPQPCFGAFHGIARETSELMRNNNNNQNHLGSPSCTNSNNNNNNNEHSYFSHHNEVQPVPPSSSLGFPPSSTMNAESQKVLNYQHNNIFANNNNRQNQVQMNGSNNNNNNNNNSNNIHNNATVNATSRAETKFLSSNNNTVALGGGAESGAMSHNYHNNNLVHQNSNNYNLSNQYQYLPSLSLNVSAQQASVSLGKIEVGNFNNNNNHHHHRVLVGGGNQEKKKIDWEELDKKIPFSPICLAKNNNNVSSKDQETLLRNQRRQLFDSFEISPTKNTTTASSSSSSPLRISYPNLFKGLSQHLKSTNVEEVLGYFATAHKNKNNNSCFHNIIKMAFNTTKLAVELAAVCRESLAASPMAKLVIESEIVTNSVGRLEFRLVLAYLRFYFELFQLFDSTSNVANANDQHEREQEQFLPHSVTTGDADAEEDNERQFSSNSVSATKPVTFEMFQRTGPILERWGVKILDDANLEDTFKNIVAVDKSNNTNHENDDDDQSNIKNLEVDFNEFAAWAMAQNLLALDQE